MKRIGLLCLAAACGSSSSKQPDAAVHVDAPADVAQVIDAPVDGALDAPADAPPAMGSHHHYVVNRFIWPRTNTETRDDAFDLSGDGVVDNQLGQVLASLSSQGFDVQTPTDQAIAHGASITLADLQATDLTTATNAGFTLYAGTNPNPMPCNGAGDTTCGRHLTGTGSFDAAAMPRDTPLSGAIAGGQYTGGPGHLSVPLYVLTGMPATVTLLGARAKLTPTASGVMQGIIGGAVSQTDIENHVYPAMQQAFTAAVAQDCSMLQSPPSCGCTQSSQGATLIGLFDTDQNCAISLMEIENNSLIMSLFQPDVTVEGQQALSFGFAFTAVDATYTP